MLYSLLGTNKAIVWEKSDRTLVFRVINLLSNDTIIQKF